MSDQPTLHFDVDINVINHLGIGLYSSTPAALAELVANAWDADAKNVTIRIDDAANSIVITDDGHGMTLDTLQKKFLKVGYSRRNSETESKSASGTRYVMGRKGIGKLAIFALAGQIKISTQSKGQAPIGFEIDVEQFKKTISVNQHYHLKEITPKEFPEGQGTIIELLDVPVGLNRTPKFLRTKLARRFSVIGDNHDFKIIIDDCTNKSPVTIKDRGFYDHIQFLWHFDEDSKKDVSALAPNIAKIKDPANDTNEIPCIAQLAANVTNPNDVNLPFKITGYIASVEKPSQLGSKEESANMLSVFANGKVFAENLFADVNSAKIYQSYLVGEIHADFLDRDIIDRATANREAIKKDDPNYQALLGFVRSTLTSIDVQWDEWRISLALDEDDPMHASITAWLGTLDVRDQKSAHRLISSIQKAAIHADESKNLAAKKVLYSGAIVGFEKLRLRKQLDRLEDITDVMSPEFAAIFASLNDVEETAYAEITKQRLEVIKKFKGIANDPLALEKVAQEYLFDNLWLLDPSWDRVTGRGEMEVTLTQYLKQQVPDSTEGARLDISYRMSSGRHVIVELKKPGKTSLNFTDLLGQVRRYKAAITGYYKTKEPSKPVPPLDIYVLVARQPSSDDPEADRQTFAAQNGIVITYEQLINDSTNIYQEYLDTHPATGKISSILSGIQ